VDKVKQPFSGGL